MAPKHTNPEYLRQDAQEKTYRAVAPYNFVPLPDKVEPVLPGDLPTHDKYTGLTGSIECQLETRTPLYTRTAITPAFFKRWGDKVREMLKASSDPGETLVPRDEYAQFFHLIDAAQPLIPGSSLRGMLRTLAEILASAKVQWVTNDPLVYRAVGDQTGLGQSYREQLMEEHGHQLTPKMQAGYMERRGHGWYIRPAKRNQGVSFARIHSNRVDRKQLTRWHSCKNAYHLWVQLGNYEFQPLQGGFRKLKYLPVVGHSVADPGNSEFKKAVLVYSGYMNNKRREAVIFEPDDTATPIEVSEELERRYREQISPEQVALLNHRNESPDGVLREHQPVFYLLDGDRLVFFGHTMMLRLPYFRSPYEMVPRPLRDGSQVDMAEAIFGYAPDSKESKQRQPAAYAGRVFFGDASLVAGQENVNWQPKPFAPQILSSPKATSFQHYLTQQEPDDVDSGQRTRDGRPKLIRPLNHYASPPPYDTTIRGTKLYWHRKVERATNVVDGEFAAKPYAWEGRAPFEQQADKPDTQHTIMHPVRAGLRFRFTVRFENLLEHELGLLLWALQPGSADSPVTPDAQPDYCHKLGMGKPLGLGSVKMSVQRLWVETADERRKRYTTLFGASNDAEGGEAKNFLRWATPGTDHTQTVADYKRRFEEKMTDGKNSFAAGERIRMLLKLMEWPGPARDDTRYMTLEEFKPRPVLPDPLRVQRRLGPGYQPRLRHPMVETHPSRNVPPARHAAAQKDATTPAPAPAPPSAHTAAIEAAAKRAFGLEDAGGAPPETTLAAGETSTESQSSAARAVEAPATLEGMLPGLYIKVKVSGVQGNAVVFTTSAPGVEATLTAERIEPPVQDFSELAERFPAGSDHALWVVGVNKRGRVQLSMRPPAKGVKAG